MDTSRKLRNSRLAMWFRIPYRRIFRQLEDHGISEEHQLRFLTKCRGIIHVGANIGQEAWIYGLMKKRVCWFEPIPDVYERLALNISKYKRQKAFNDLITDETGRHYEFHLANNDGESSSIFDLDLHRSMFPEVEYNSSISLTSITLDDAFDKYRISNRFDALVIDAQGSELLVLKGARKALEQIKWIYLECSDFSAYRGGCLLEEIDQFLNEHGFSERRRDLFKELPGVGCYFNIFYARA